MQISSLGGWLVSALPIPIGGEWHNSSTDFNPNTNSSILLQCKNKLQVHIKPTPTKQDPKQKYSMYYCMCSTEYHHQYIYIFISHTIYCMWNKNPIKWHKIYWGRGKNGNVSVFAGGGKWWFWRRPVLLPSPKKCLFFGRYLAWVDLIWK